MYEQHVRQLADQIGVSLYFDAEPYRAQYIPMFRTVHTQEIRNWGVVPIPPDMIGLTSPVDYTEQTCYFVALHELGHAASGHDEWSLRTRGALRCEAEAWRWAIDHGLERMDGDSASFAAVALEAYGVAYFNEQDTLHAQTVQTLRQWSR